MSSSKSKPTPGAARCAFCRERGFLICLDPSAEACSRALPKVPPADKSLPPTSGTTLHRARRNTWWRRLLGLEIDRDE